MRGARALLFCVAAAAVGGAAALPACGGGGFDPQSAVNSVRMFAARVDKPYARPGETVNFEVLLTDGRADKTRPLKLYWIPIVCLNPRDDLYYLCFAPPSGDAGAGGSRFLPVGPLADAGVPEAGAGPGGGGGPLQSIPTGIDIGPFLPQGPTFSFRMPDDVIQPREGIEDYGIAYVFNIACAGQVRLAQPSAGGGPQQVPLQCTDEDGNPLPPSDYVIGFARVYSYANRTNTNPVIAEVTLAGQPVDLAKGITLPPCRGVKRRADCPEHKIDVRVAEESWEPNPSEVEAAANAREQIWVTYYSDQGRFQDDARLLFDPRRGRVSESEVVYRAPADPAEGTIWAVVHDNRGGTAWVVVPLHVRDDAPPPGAP